MELNITGEERSDMNYADVSFDNITFLEVNLFRSMIDCVHPYWPQKLH